MNQVLMLLRSIDRSLKCLPAVQHEHYAQSLRVNRR
jgi:protein-disulfide isomerase-like protein with CxxC motif